MGDLKILERNIGKSFSHVKEDIDYLEKSTGKKFVKKEDFIKLFTEIKDFKAEMLNEFNKVSKKVDSMDKKLDTNLNSMKNSINNELKDAVALKKETFKAIKKKELTRHEISKIKVFEKDIEYFTEEMKKDVKAFKENMGKDVKEFKENTKKEVEKSQKETGKVNKFEGKHEQNVKELAEFKNEFNKLKKKLNEFVYAGINVDDVDKHYYTREEAEKSRKKLMNDVDKRLKAVNDRCVKKDTVEKELAGLSNKVKSVKEELDELNEGMKKDKKTGKVFAERKELDELKKNVVSSKALKELEKDINKMSYLVYGIEDDFLKKKDSVKDMEKIRNDVNKKLKKLGEEYSKKDEKEFKQVNEKVKNMKEEVDELNEVLTEMRKQGGIYLEKKDFSKFKDDILKKDALKLVDKNFESVKDDIKKVSREMKSIEMSDGEIRKVRADVEKIKENLILKKEVNRILETTAKKFKSLKEDMDKIEKDIGEMGKDKDAHDKINKLSEEFNTVKAVMETKKVVENKVKKKEEKKAKKKKK